MIYYSELSEVLDYWMYTNIIRQQQPLEYIWTHQEKEKSEKGSVSCSGGRPVNTACLLVTSNRGRPLGYMDQSSVWDDKARARHQSKGGKGMIQLIFSKLAAVNLVCNQPAPQPCLVMVEVMRHRWKYHLADLMDSYKLGVLKKK